ncbi:MAG TPA: hypothetical protein VFG51_02080 [Candidatus Saccharimonadia bacterium]|nr:hypothetical protein [Candidatus Saccharimonadia bacterium]
MKTLLFGLFFAVAAVYWFQIGGEQTVLLRNTLYLLFPLIAIIFGLFALKQYGLRGQRTALVACLTLGMMGLFTGEVLFYLYEFVFNINPFPSIADFFYLLAYPLFLYALIHELRQTPINWKSIRPATRFLFLILSAAFALLVLYFGVYLVYDPGMSLTSNAIAIAYGLGDLGLIVVDLSVLVLAWEFRRGTFSSLWMRLFLSFIAMLVGDILFAIYSVQYQSEVWIYKSVIDTFFMLSYVFFAYGLLHFGFSILKAKSKIKKKL